MGYLKMYGSYMKNMGGYTGSLGRIYDGIYGRMYKEYIGGIQMLTEVGSISGPTRKCRFAQ